MKLQQNHHVPAGSNTSTRGLSLAGAGALVLAAIGASIAYAQTGKISPIIPGGNSKAPISIDAGRLDFFDKESKLVYSGGVIAKQGNASLRASALTIFLKKDAVRKTQSGDSNDQVRRMEAKGPVTIRSRDQVGTGDKGVYDRTANKVYLIGNPVLTQGPNIVRGGAGARLVYDLNTGRARITGGRVQSIIVPRGKNSRN